MTLKGRKNHFNVKLLRGYGVSISLKNKKIILRNGRDVFSGNSEIEEWFVTKIPYEKIVVSGRGYLSTEAIKLLNQNNKNVILTDTYGHPISYINGMMNSLTGTKYRIEQYDAFRNPEICKKLSQKIIHDKVESQIRFLKMTENDLVKDGIIQLEKYLSDLKSSDHSTIEAKVGRIYFREYAKLIPSRYGFESRNQLGTGNSKRRAGDVINGLLNYGYTVLAGEISKFVCGFGLDPYYGFMHKSHTGFQPLVYDIIEPFRWLVDYSVWKIANNQDKRRRIKLKEFVFTKNGSIVLDDSLIKRFLERLERTFQMEREYKFNSGRKMKNGMSMCQEITIAKIFVQDLINF